MVVAILCSPVPQQDITEFIVSIFCLPNWNFIVTSTRCKQKALVHLKAPRFVVDPRAVLI